MASVSFLIQLSQVLEDADEILRSLHIAVISQEFIHTLALLFFTLYLTDADEIL